MVCDTKICNKIRWYLDQKLAIKFLWTCVVQLWEGHFILQLQLQTHLAAARAMASSKWILLQAIAAGISPKISLLRPTKLRPPGLHIPPESAW